MLSSANPTANSASCTTTHSRKIFFIHCLDRSVLSPNYSGTHDQKDEVIMAKCASSRLFVTDYVSPVFSLSCRWAVQALSTPRHSQGGGAHRRCAHGKSRVDTDELSGACNRIIRQFLSLINCGAKSLHNRATGSFRRFSNYAESCTAKLEPPADDQRCWAQNRAHGTSERCVW